MWPRNPDSGRIASLLWEAVLAGYLEGLADAGWRGNARLVRFGTIAMAALHYGFLIPMVTISVALDERRHAAFEQSFNAPIAERVARSGSVSSFILE